MLNVTAHNKILKNIMFFINKMQENFLYLTIILFFKSASTFTQSVVALKELPSLHPLYVPG